MPIYEYFCHACGREFETIQKITADPLKQCELCDGKPIERLISQTNFQLKGQGWYVTDFKNKEVKESKDQTSNDKDAHISEKSSTETSNKRDDSKSSEAVPSTSEKSSKTSNEKAATPKASAPSLGNNSGKTANPKTPTRPPK